MWGNMDIFWQTQQILLEKFMLIYLRDLISIRTICRINQLQHIVGEDFCFVSDMKAEEDGKLWYIGSLGHCCNS